MKIGSADSLVGGSLNVTGEQEMSAFGYITSPEKTQGIKHTLRDEEAGTMEEPQTEASKRITNVS